MRDTNHSCGDFLIQSECGVYCGLFAIQDKYVHLLSSPRNLIAYTVALKSIIEIVDLNFVCIQ